MRRSIIYIFLLFGGLVLPGCSELMETSPTTQVDSSLILKDADAAQAALNGIYSSMYTRIDWIAANTHQTFGYMAVVLCAEVMGEDMVHTAEGAGWFFKDYSYEMRVRYTSKIWRSYFTWKYFYELISNANYILSVEDTLEGDPGRVKNIMGQAHAIRAYCYFMLVQSFQQTYVGHQSLPGVPVYTEATTNATEGKGRGTVEDVYLQINADIDRAVELIEESGIEQDHISHIDYYAANLLKARIALVQNRWRRAADAAKIAGEKPGRSLLSISDATVVKGTFDNATNEWRTGSTPFNSKDSPSVLWGAEVISEQSRVFGSFYAHMDACTDVYYAAESPKCISNWLYSQIDESDVRRGWWNGDIGVPASQWKYGANINYNQHKFQWKNQQAHTGDYIFMRAEEACLIHAEALCQLEKYDSVRILLSELGTRRDPNYARRLARFTDSREQTFASVGTPTTLMDEVLLQRRIELWGEAGRIYDILRLARGWTRYWEVNGQPSNHTNYLSKYSEYLAFPADYRECIMMIPQAEIDNNPNISADDQNPFVQ